MRLDWVLGLHGLDYTFKFFLVSYVEERPWWPIQAPTNEEEITR